MLHGSAEGTPERLDDEMILVFLVLLAACALIMGTAYPLFCAHDGVNITKPLLSLIGEEDDSDIKIAGVIIKYEDEALSDAKELERLKANGNLDKARRLGLELSQKITDEDGDPAFARDNSESDEIRMQRRILLAFAVDNAINNNIKNKILGKVIVNAFYGMLKKNVPDFYEDLGESGSFSFYYLCIRRGGNSAERCVGQSFAMLAGNKGDPIMEELGEALFFHFNDVVEKNIKACGIIG